jgi:hypothetical protein
LWLIRLKDPNKTYLVNIKKSKEVKVVKKAEFHELKTNIKKTREIKEGKEDKFMMLMSKNKTKKPLEKFHLTAIQANTVTSTSQSYINAWYILVYNGLVWYLMVCPITTHHEGSTVGFRGAQWLSTPRHYCTGHSQAPGQSSVDQDETSRE